MVDYGRASPRTTPWLSSPASLPGRGGCSFFGPPWSCKSQPAQVMAQLGVLVALLVQSSSEDEAAPHGATPDSKADAGSLAPEGLPESRSCNPSAALWDGGT